MLAYQYLSSRCFGGLAVMSGRHPLTAVNKLESVLLLRWVLIIATSYLVLFSRPLTQVPPSAPLFIVVYFLSNLGLRRLRAYLPSDRAFDATLVLLDTGMLSVGLGMTGMATSQFFVLYFVVVFLSALTERVELLVAATVLVSTTYFYSIAQFTGLAPLLTTSYTLRIPFLFAVALFFGQLVSEARARERAAEETRSQELRMEFLSTFSHDLKNPLGSIQGLSSLLLEGEGGALTERQTMLVRRIHASARHLITFALNLIDAARIDAGRLALQQQETDVGDVVEDALLLARCAGDLKGIALHSSVAPNLPRAEVDALQLERVISNLVGNAVKFTPAGGSVTLSVWQAGDGIVLEVADTGIGIAPDELPKVFEEYSHYAPNRSIDGSGLGLYIVKAIVEAHGGNVTVTSTLGQGATVTVNLPIKSSQTKSPAASPQSASPELVPSILTPAAFGIRQP
jgi:signal transduction histidine kinase